MKLALIVPAAGSGKRLGAQKPKALVEIEGVPMVRRTLARFASVPDLIETVVVVPRGAVLDFNAALGALEFRVGEMRVVGGGDTRQQSVRFGIEALQSTPDFVCIHDAARPLVSRETIHAVIQAARATGAATAAVRPTDSVREELGEGKTRPLRRSSLWMVQTPQVFRYDLLSKAHQTARAMGTQVSDDAALMDAAGVAVAIVETVGANPKITESEDLELARLLLAREAARHH